MAQVAIIIGNGFDLDLGLKTRYSDFMKSPEFEEIYNNRRKIDPSFSLLEYLKTRAESHNWFDMELAIHDYVLEHNTVEALYVEAIKNEFDSLKVSLCKYLNRITSEFKVQDNRLPVMYMGLLKYCYEKTIVEIYFNYTFPRLVLNRKNNYSPEKHAINYVHGNLKENNIVLGCDLQPEESVNRKLSFMYKYNMLNRANHIARDLMEATEIIFYGHSVNEMDFCYFKEFFRAASASPEPQRHLTFITLDEKSERDIKDNIRNQGISVSDLYNNLEAFEFIHTSKIYNKEEEENQKWINMWKRLIGSKYASLVNIVYHWDGSRDPFETLKQALLRKVFE